MLLFNKLTRRRFRARRRFGTLMRRTFGKRTIRKFTLHFGKPILDRGSKIRSTSRNTLHKSNRFRICAYEVFFSPFKKRVYTKHQVKDLLQEEKWLNLVCNCPTFLSSILRSMYMLCFFTIKHFLHTHISKFKKYILKRRPSVLNAIHKRMKKRKRVINCKNMYDALFKIVWLLKASALYKYIAYLKRCTRMAVLFRLKSQFKVGVRVKTRIESLRKRYRMKNLKKLINRMRQYSIVYSAVQNGQKKKKLKMPNHIFWHFIYKSVLLRRFITAFMRCGKKEKVEQILFHILSLVKRKTKKQPIFLFNSIVNALQPVVHHRNVTRSGKIYQVPFMIGRKRRLFSFFNTLKDINYEFKKVANFKTIIAEEFTKAINKDGNLYSRIIDLHRTAFSNRINLRFIRKFMRRRSVFI